jgi:hypothetical protein
VEPQKYSRMKVTRIVNDGWRKSRRSRKWRGFQIVKSGLSSAIEEGCTACSEDPS